MEKKYVPCSAEYNFAKQNFDFLRNLSPEDVIYSDSALGELEKFESSEIRTLFCDIKNFDFRLDKREYADYGVIRVRENDFIWKMCYTDKSGNDLIGWESILNAELVVRYIVVKTISELPR